MLDWPTHMEWPNTHARTYEDTHTHTQQPKKSRKSRKKKEKAKNRMGFQGTKKERQAKNQTEEEG